MIITETAISKTFPFKCLSSLQFLLAPSLYISVQYFVKPNWRFKKTGWLHFAPFTIYIVTEMVWNHGKESISTLPIFAINKDVSFLVRDILPFLTLFYLAKSYASLAKHKKNLKLISSNINQVSLGWLVQFLFILLLTVIIWINDALFELPFLTEATSYIYAVSIFFLAYFSIKQKTIFAFKQKDIKEISEVLAYQDYKPEVKIISEEVEAITGSDTSINISQVSEAPKEKPKLKRLSTEQTAILSLQLSSLMEKEKLFLDNDLNLPAVAEKLNISIHEASFLINETAKDNFYNYINKYRVEEAKKLLASSKMGELNILGIAFASGFNSKTTFNTTFKKIVGISPSQYSKEQKN
jgi:AraC-like DNA-binding protein